MPTIDRTAISYADNAGATEPCQATQEASTAVVAAKHACVSQQAHTEYIHCHARLFAFIYKVCSVHVYLVSLLHQLLPSGTVGDDRKV